jgi:3-sulfinopropanoyl-CoA desulfinase
MGLRGIPETEVIFEDLSIQEDMLVLPPRGLRRGFGDLINAYNSQRVGAGTVALGIAQGAFEKAVAFVKERNQFGRPIAEFQGLQWMLADMAIALNGARLALHQAALSANPFPDPLLAAQAKILASETAISVTNQALQLHGARGYSRDYPLERMVRDARMFAIAGGTAQVLRTLVASRLLDMKLPQTRDGYVKHDMAPTLIVAK